MSDNPYHDHTENAEAETSKHPSYLAVLRDKFYAKLKDSSDIKDVWNWVSAELRRSYWNGVEHGASGKVKPKPKS